MENSQAWSLENAISGDQVDSFAP